MRAMLLRAQAPIASDPLAAAELPPAEPGPGEALVEILACGLCHTDLGFADGSVAPRHGISRFTRRYHESSFRRS